MTTPVDNSPAPSSPPAAGRPCFRVEVFTRQAEADSAGRAQYQAARQLGYDNLTRCRAGRLYFLQGDLAHDDVARIARRLLADPVTEEWTMSACPPPAAVVQPAPAGDYTLDVALLPGVTDSAADNLVRAAQLLGVAGLERAATGQTYRLQGQLSPEEVAQLAAALFANPVIQRFSLNHPISPPFVPFQPADDTVETIPLRDADDEQLLAVSAQRRLALNLAEMQAIQAYFQQEGRDPTDAELETLAQTWSEHCVHKTFKATIHYTGPLPGQPAGAPPVKQEINGLLRSYIRAATEKINKPWVRSAFVDNAGIIAFNDQFDLAFKVETHNHPSALEPFGGANTGVGGVVRDVLGVSARPIANSDILCFGPPDLPDAALPAGVLHPRRIADGVVHGIEDYGNKMGIPTVNGAIFYHAGYTANPLVYCGCLGILPRDSHPTKAQEGDLIVALGGRTGRDGLRGATFSSMEMDQETSEIAGSAVQIGNPIQEKQVLEAVLRARDEKLYNAITDCGAGGFSSAVGEMGQALGAAVQLANAPLKYPGLRPWEIWLSEAQERMVLAVPPEKWPRLQEICAGQDVIAVVIGRFEASGRLRLHYHDRFVGDLSLDFLHEGLPERVMEAEWRPAAPAGDDAPARPTVNAGDLLRLLLAHPNIRSKEDVIRRYDHEVQGATAVKPLVGADNHGPSDAAVLAPLESGSGEAANPGARPGVVLANGICPQYGEIDPYLMAWAAVDEAVRNAVAVGADPDRIAILDNFCWGNPNLPDRLGSLTRCAQGCYDAAVAYQTPFISGKDSLNNEYSDAGGQKHAIPGTLLISALGIAPNLAQTVTMDLKQPGSFLFMVGETERELAGSHLAALVPGLPEANQLPQPPANGLARYRALHQAIQAGLVLACHDCSEGGVGVALAEMCLAGRVGAHVELAALPRGEHAHYLADELLLFAESLGRFIVEVHPAQADAFRALMTKADVPHDCVGVTGGERLTIQGRSGRPLLDLPVAELEKAWRGDAPALETGEQPAAGRSSPPPAIRSSRRPVLILHANGTNRDREAALACELAGGRPEIVHVNQLLAGERRLLDYHMLVLPGGFSYGDDLGAGKLWALDLERRLDEAMRRFVAEGRPVLGICNGFQALVKAGLLPGAAGANETPPLTLTFNESGHFECRWVYLQANEPGPCLFTQGVTELIYCPAAHGEGRLAARDEAALHRLQEGGLIALSYVNPAGGPAAYPANPNGSALNIAGLTNPAGNVLGLMPHPEDHIFPWQHPRRGRGEAGMLGLRLFQNGLRNS